MSLIGRGSSSRVGRSFSCVRLKADKFVLQVNAERKRKAVHIVCFSCARYIIQGMLVFYSLLLYADIVGQGLETVVIEYKDV